MIIDLTPGSEPIAGRIAAPDGVEHEFSGYMGLISTLADALPSAEPEREDPADSPL